jgi:hypothetical protein
MADQHLVEEFHGFISAVLIDQGGRFLFELLLLVGLCPDICAKVGLRLAFSPWA